MSRKITVLLGAPDNINPVRKLIADRLQEVGFDVTIARVKEEIEEHFESADLLLIDARMLDERFKPNTRAFGLDTVVKLAAEGRLRNDVPVIFFSVMPQYYDFFQPAFAALSESQRPYRFLKRPFELDLLLSVISDELKKTGTPSPV